MKLLETTHGTATQNRTINAVKRTPGVPEGVAALATIGEEIGRRWAERKHRDQSFHDIPAECLLAARHHRQFDKTRSSGG